MSFTGFLERVFRLKNIRRTGWLERGVSDPESVASHSFMTTLIALVLGLRWKSIHLEKALKLAIAHDLPESVVGDLISKEYWNDGGSVSRKKKLKLERKAMKKLSEEAECPELFEFWEEYENGNSEEADFVREIDKFEMICQAIKYKKEMLRIVKKLIRSVESRKNEHA